MFLIDWFHLYLRNPERRISENFKNLTRVITAARFSR